MLIRLIYASRAATLGPMDVKDILASSRRNNARLGVSGALCLSNGIFLQSLEGDRATVNALYHRILLDPRHKEPAILDFSDITSRQFASWNMGLIASTADNEAMFLKYSPAARFDPYQMSAEGLRAFFSEALTATRWLS